MITTELPELFPDISITHNSDWSGVAYINYWYNDAKYKWSVEGKALLNGRFLDEPSSIPASIIAQAVAVATRTYLSQHAVRFGEDLLGAGL